MIMSSLLALFDDREDFVKRFNAVGIPKTEITLKSVIRCGIQGMGVSVKVKGVEEGVHEHHEHHEHHAHHHEHHHHSGMEDIQNIINSLSVSETVKKNALNVYMLIAEAESAVHGKSVAEIHFHEVGTLDAIADIVGTCMLIEEINPDRIVVSSVGVGSGQVKCAHGILPVPAPATAHILRGVPICAGNIKGELCTPTGAALLKYFADEFVTENTMTVNEIGYGMGKKQFFDADGNEILSAVRAMIGLNGNKKDSITILSCNIDDMTGEQAGFALERLMECGALDVYTTPVYMKKNRPGILLTLMCKNEDKERMSALIFKYTTTIGVRAVAADRFVLSRSEKTIDTSYGEIKAKQSEGYGVSRVKAEYEDLRKIALENDISIADIK